MSELQTTPEVTPTPVTVVAETKPSIEDTMAQVYEKNYPDTRVNRAENGKFESKEPKAPEVKAEGAETSDTVKEIPQEPTTETVKPEETPAIDMPASWAADRKEEWEKLSPGIRQFIADRESQAQTKMSELGRAAKATEPYRPHLEALEGLAKANGLQSHDALQRLVAAGYRLQQDPKSAIQWLAQSYGVDLSQFAPMPQIGDNPESAHINALTQKISQLEQKLGETTNHITAQRQQELAAREQTLTASIEKFAGDPSRKDHWADVEGEVYRQVKVLSDDDPARAKAEPMAILKEAYDRAVTLTPAVKTKLEKAAKDEAEKKAEAERKKKADEAKRLSSLNAKSSTGAAPKASSKDMYSEMAEIYDKLQATG